MKQNKKLIIGVLIVLFLIIIFLLYINRNNKNTIISIQNEKIKDLDDILSSEKIDNDENKDKVEAENKIKDKEDNKIEDNMDEDKILEDEENLGNDLNFYKLYNDAEEYYNNGEYKKAIENLKLIADIEPEASGIFEKLAKSYSKIGKYDKAIEIYKDLIIRFPYDSGYYGQLGFSFNENNQKDKGSLFLIIGFVLDGKDLKLVDLKDENDKKMYNLEYQTIVEFINNEEYEDLRKYIFNKYLGEKIMNMI